MKRILILAPHTDDGEIGCGGSIAKFIEQGKDVFHVAFSTARTSSVQNGYPDNILEQEVKAATQVLGIKKSNLILYDFNVRKFPECRQDILEEMIKLRKDINPDLIFVPSLNDIHQDHQVVAREGLRAFKRHSILGYEEPWNNIIFESRSFIQLEKRHMEKKIEALNCYQSQKRRSYLTEEAIWGIAKLRGTQLEGGYAEAFEVLRWIVNA
ncbi:PIG-L family deacetylase [Candidatus Pacearchaeota archaeon]|nr:PIG-L family deacetylase [Candidatus Pacearchaeota archaeon]